MSTKKTPGRQTGGPEENHDTTATVRFVAHDTPQGCPECSAPAEETPEFEDLWELDQHGRPGFAWCEDHGVVRPHKHGTGRLAAVDWTGCDPEFVKKRAAVDIVGPRCLVDGGFCTLQPAHYWGRPTHVHCPACWAEDVLMARRLGKDRWAAPWCAGCWNLLTENLLDLVDMRSNLLGRCA